eukprot:scaffold2638_cov114-Cylindrotheca_fusiformis.AAC.16
MSFDIFECEKQHRCGWEHSTEFASLTLLTVLRFSDNNRTGTIPSEIGTLTQLTELGLDSNQFQSTIPTEIGKVVAVDISAIGRIVV